MVCLRSEHNGDDSRYLHAHLAPSGDLLIEGEDSGPATALVSSDGEYEWLWVGAVDKLPELLRVLGAGQETGVLDELEAHWSGAASYELERHLRESGLASLEWMG